MYRLTNLTLDTTTTYKNKDLVYQALERENAKVKHQEAEGMLLVEELDKKGVVFYQEDIYLPFQGIADSLFLRAHTTTTPETMKKEKRLSFLKSSKRNHSSFFKILKRAEVFLLLSVSLGLSGVMTILVIHQNKQVANLTQQVEQLESLQSETGKLDVFARYFLPHYYSEQGQLNDFVSPKLDLDHPSGQLQSVILESTGQAGDKAYQLTYVLAIKDGETRKQRRLTLMVKAASSAPYGYQITKEPKQTAYPK